MNVVPLRPDTPAGEVTTQQAPGASPAPSAVPPPASDADRRLSEIRRRMQRYRDLASQGKWAEAGKELEALESVLR